MNIQTDRQINTLIAILRTFSVDEVIILTRLAYVISKFWFEESSHRPNLLSVII